MGCCTSRDSNANLSRNEKIVAALGRSKKYEDVLHKCEQVRSKVEWIQKTEGLSEEERSQLHDIEVRRQFNRLLSDSGSALAPAPPHDPTHLDRYREVTFHIPDDDDYFAYPPPPVGSAEASMVGTPAAVDSTVEGSPLLMGPSPNANLAASSGDNMSSPRGMRPSNSLSIIDGDDDGSLSAAPIDSTKKSDDTAPFTLATFVVSTMDPMTQLNENDEASPHLSIGPDVDLFAGSDRKQHHQQQCATDFIQCNNRNGDSNSCIVGVREKLNTSVTSVGHRSILKKGSEKELLSTNNLENSISQRSIGSARVRFGEVEVN